MQLAYDADHVTLLTSCLFQSIATLNGGSERKMSRLEAVNGDRKPSITVNGSERSIHSLIEATGSKLDVKKNASASSLRDDGKSLTGRLYVLAH